jgi:hypothetical protein
MKARFFRIHTFQSLQYLRSVSLRRMKYGKHRYGLVGVKTTDL